MKHKILSAVFILSLVLLPSNVARAGGGGGLTSLGKILTVATIVFVAGPFGLAAGSTLTGWGIAAIGTGVAVGVGYIQCSGGQDNVSFEGCGGGNSSPGGVSGQSGEGGGRGVAACVPNAGQPCSGASNACGAGGGSGTIQCDGVCGIESPGDSYGDWSITGSPPPDTCDGNRGYDAHGGNTGMQAPFTCPVGASGSCQDASWNCGPNSCATFVRSVTCSSTYIPVGAPPLPANYGQTCSVANICGQSNSGTFQCSGSCSASAPPLPSNYGQNCLSPANSCGLRNGGSIGCTNNCSAQFPPPESACENLNAGGGTTLTANPTLTGMNGFTDLAWSSDEDTCVLYNSTSGQLLATSTEGTKREGPINSTRRYVLTCEDESASVTVRPDFDFEEF